jgi:hypothetical protein
MGVVRRVEYWDGKKPRDFTTDGGDESDKRAISVALFAGKDGGKRMGLKFDRVK